VDPKTRSEVLEWGVRALSSGVVAVELKPEAVADAWDAAKRWWAGLRGMSREAVAVGGAGRYTMPSDCEMVIDVFFCGESLGITDFEPYVMLDVDEISATSLSVPWSSFYSTLGLYMQRHEMGRRILSAEPSWDWDQESSALLIYPTTYTGAIIAHYLSTEVRDEDPVHPATLPRNDLRRMRNRDRDLLLRWFVADLKDRLGRVRGKYQGGLPSAGGLQQLDGDVLRGEAAEEKQTLKDEAISLSDSPPMIIG